MNQNSLSNNCKYKYCKIRSFDTIPFCLRGETNHRFTFLAFLRCQPSTDVAHEAFVFGAFDGGAFEEGAVLILGEISPVVGRHLQ